MGTNFERVGERSLAEEMLRKEGREGGFLGLVEWICFSCLFVSIRG